MTIPLPQRRRNSILLTALADVMFVLLFFFMLTAATVDRRGLALDVSAGSTDVPADAINETVLLLIAPGRWQLGQTVLSPGDLPRALRQGHRARVRIVAAPGLPLQSLIDAIGVVRAAGLPLQLARGVET